MTPAPPQPLVVREGCHKGAWQHGYCRVLGETDGWAAFGSTTAPGSVWLAAAGEHGPWVLALDHPGVVAELDLPLAALWDAAFDRALVTFDEDGKPEFSPKLSKAAREALTWSQPIELKDSHRQHLEHHHQRFQQEAGADQAD